MKTLVLMLVCAATVFCQETPKITLSVDVPKKNYHPEELIRVRVLFRNIGEASVRVPRRFPNSLGLYPSARIGFISRDGKTEWSGGPEAWPQSRHLQMAEIDQETVELGPGAYYGDEVLAMAPKSPGCYSLKVYLKSWDSINPSPQTNRVLLGDLESTTAMICVRPKQELR